MTMAQATAAGLRQHPAWPSRSRCATVIASTKAITGETAWAGAGLFRCDGRER